MKKLFFAFFLSFVLSGCTATVVIKQSDSEASSFRVESSPADKNKKSPTVLIGHGSGGVTAAPRELVSLVNSWGYNAVIIDHYTLRGISRHTGREVQGATGKDRARDFIDAGRWVNKQDWHQGKIAVVGFSQGGGGVLTLVDEKKMREYEFVTDKKSNPISAASAFYPSCYFNPVPKSPSMPTQIHLAGADDLARPSFCYFHSRESYEIHTYENATHSFDEYIHSSVQLSFTHKFDRKITLESRNRLKLFLDAHLK